MILFPPVISWVDTTFVLIKVLPLGHKYQPICNALGKMSALPVVQFLWCLHSYSSMCRCCWVAPLITRRKAEQQSGTLLWDAFTGLKLRLDHLLVFSPFYLTSESSHEWESLGDTVNSVSIAFCLSFFWQLTLSSLNWWQLLSKKCSRMDAYGNLNERRLCIVLVYWYLKTNCYKAMLFW